MQHLLLIFCVTCVAVTRPVGPITNTMMVCEDPGIQSEGYVVTCHYNDMLEAGMRTLAQGG